LKDDKKIKMTKVHRTKLGNKLITISRLKPIKNTGNALKKG